MCLWNDDIYSDSRLRNVVTVEPQLTELDWRRIFTIDVLAAGNTDDLHGSRRRSVIVIISCQYLNYIHSLIKIIQNSRQNAAN